MTISCSKFVAKKNILIFGHDRDFLGQNNSPRVQPILVGPFLFDRYWIDLEFKKNPGVLADPKKMQRFFKIALSKMSKFGPLLLVADWFDLENSKKGTRYCPGLCYNISKAHPNQSSIK
ncbi:MAG: hypothetical protein GY820_33280 [Gammaproteobacteria bacterium]|nr:hypothetical protein [Gammaproteobacteria bacterium]